MSVGSIQMCRSLITSIESKDICSSLDLHALQVLSLRECNLDDVLFKRILRSVGQCKSLLQLGLNVGLINSADRVKIVAKALHKNRSLKTLFMHGSDIGDDNISVLMKALVLHPNIVSLDLGQCKLGDMSITLICDLLPSQGAKPGLRELSLSGNPLVTSKGWSKLFIAISACSSLKALYLDYNAIGNYGAGCLSVMIASNNTLELLDLEGTGITDHGAKTLLHLLKNYDTTLKTLNLAGNKINRKTIEAVTQYLVNRDEIIDVDGASDDGSDNEEDSVDELEPSEYQMKNKKRQKELKNSKVKHPSPSNVKKLEPECEDENNLTDGSGDENIDEREQVLDMFEELMSLDEEKLSNDSEQEYENEKLRIDSERSKRPPESEDDDVESENGTVIVHSDVSEPNISTGEQLSTEITSTSKNVESSKKRNNDESSSDEGEFLTEVPVNSAPVHATFVPVRVVQSEGSFQYCLR